MATPKNKQKNKVQKCRFNFFAIFPTLSVIIRNWEIKLQLKRGDCIINGAYNLCTVKLVYRLAVHILKESKT